MAPHAPFFDNTHNATLINLLAEARAIWCSPWMWALAALWWFGMVGTVVWSLVPHHQIERRVAGWVGQGMMAVWGWFGGKELRGGEVKGRQKEEEGGRRDPEGEVKGDEQEEREGEGEGGGSGARGGGERGDEVEEIELGIRGWGEERWGGVGTNTFGGKTFGGKTRAAREADDGVELQDVKVEKETRNKLRKLRKE
ncbi:hypothetical protein K491DRAFT_160059 [Lophiostoma macrostomum CBS 122681]|uniref:Uncharacterized protein n=1 Tax=Lophiostoma macrostomum CBS 122681 TaxID=1314788 RepID=A0A6A6SQH6_9PLEO|nr:hypothetical protein K491DRAFT_160059 [Lophiostoma macrostomum CBS 122681]